MRRKDGREKEEGRGGFFDFPPTQRISSIPSSLMASPIFHRLVISNSNRPSSSSLFSPSPPPCNRSLEAGEEGKATSTSGWRDAGCLLAAGSALIKAAITVIAILLLVRTCSRPSKLSLTDATLSSVIASLSGGNFSHRIPRSPKPSRPSAARTFELSLENIRETLAFFPNNPSPRSITTEIRNGGSYEFTTRNADSVHRFDYIPIVRITKFKYFPTFLSLYTWLGQRSFKLFPLIRFVTRSNASRMEG